MARVTALRLIEDAYEWIGALGNGQQMSAEKSARGLRRLSDILEQWSITPCIAWAKTEYTFTLTDGTVTVGPSANINIDVAPDSRSMAESPAFIRVGNQDYGVEWIDEGTYKGLSDKTISGSNQCAYAWYDSTITTGTIRLWPVPSSGVLHLSLDVALPALDDLNTEYDLPQGYRIAISQTLGESLSVGLIDPPPALVRAAMQSRKLIERTNFSAPVLRGTDAPTGASMGGNEVSKFLFGRF